MRLYEFAEPEQLDEISRRDLLKAFAAATVPGVTNAALKDPTKTDDPVERYNRFTQTSPAPLHASPKLDTERKWNRVGVAQSGNTFSIVLDKDFDLFLHFDVEYSARVPYVYIELRRGERYKFRTRIIQSDVFTIEDPRLAALLLNYEGPFKLEVGEDVYQFNITSSPDAQKLYRMWKEGDHKH